MAGRGQRRAHPQLTSPAAVSPPGDWSPCPLLSPLASSLLRLPSCPPLAPSSSCSCRPSHLSPSPLTPLQVTEARRRPPELPQPRRPSSPTSKPRPPPLDSALFHRLRPAECTQYLTSIQMTVLGTYLHQERIAGKRHPSSISIHDTPSPRHDTHRFWFLLSGGIRFKESRAWIRLIHSLRD
jgi:hypothetical protein